MPSKLKLERDIIDLSDELGELRQQLVTSIQVQQAALRRVHLLPSNIASLVDSEAVGNGILTSDGQGMTYPIGGGIDLTVKPFEGLFELTDASGRNKPLVIEFGPEQDFDQSKVLAVVGFATLAKRGETGQTTTDWVRQLNGSSTIPA